MSVYPRFLPNNIVAICGWCADKAEKQAAVLLLGFRVSHGMCDACKARELGELSPTCAPVSCAVGSATARRDEQSLGDGVDAKWKAAAEDNRPDVNVAEAIANYPVVDSNSTCTVPETFDASRAEEAGGRALRPGLSVPPGQPWAGTLPCLLLLVSFLFP